MNINAKIQNQVERHLKMALESRAPGSTSEIYLANAIRLLCPRESEFDWAKTQYEIAWIIAQGKTSEEPPSETAKRILEALFNLTSPTNTKATNDTA